jgi:hypothetical protein
VIADSRIDAPKASTNACWVTTARTASVDGCPAASMNAPVTTM